MKIAILGNGKMGKEIAELAIKMGDSITVRSNSKNPGKSLDLSTSDVCIDFSTPNSASENIIHSLKSGKPIISGTTGWLKEAEKVRNICAKYDGAFLYSENFSLGMNIFLEINEKLAEIMKNHEYTCTIHEKHHKKKKDAPSGTAKNIANKIHNLLGASPEITYDRKDDIIGTHSVTYNSKKDIIKLEHIAKDRKAFAYGALLAAKWIINKKGIFDFRDCINNRNI